MSEKIRIKDMNDPVEWALIVALAPRSKEIASVPGEPLDVEMRVNGVEVEFSTVIHRLKAEFDREVREAAVELLAERARVLDEATARAREAIEAAADRLAWDLGVERRDG